MTLDVTVSNRIMTVRLDRPESLNAIDPTLRAEWQATWLRIRDDDEVLAAILTGAGDRAFCVGTDLKAPAAPARSEAAASR